MSYKLRAWSKVISLLLTVILGAANALPAFAQEVHRFDIAASEAPAAIQEFGVQAGVQILAAADGLRGKRLSAVTGDLSTEQGLQTLLAGSGLTHRYVDDRAVALVAQAADTSNSAEIAAGSKTPSAESKRSFWDRFRLAQLDQRTSSESSSAENGKGASRAADADRIELEEVVVTGSYLGRLGGETVSPVTTYTRFDIERSGASGIGDFVLQLPQNTGLSGQFVGNTIGSPTTPNLRGLGAGATLVLVNGRRLSSSATAQSGIQPSSVNLNTIPLAAVERVEVLTDGASALYGSDAAGGVINIILRKNFSGVEATTRYGNSAGDHDAGEFTQTFATGLTRDRLSAFVGAEYYERKAIRELERDYAFAAAQSFVSATERRSVPGNVSAVPGTGNLPGLNSTFAAIPRDQDGTALQIASFQATQGTLNTPLFSSVFSPLLTPQERKSAFGNLEYEFDNGLSFFAEGRASRIDSVILTGAGFNNLLVPAANPFNPFGANVRVSVWLPEPNQNASHTDDVSGFTGAKGSFGASGTWDASVGYGRSKYSGQIRVVDQTLVSAALARTDRSTALNVFGDGRGNSREVLASVVDLRSRLGTSTNAKTVAAKTAFNIARLPAGPAKAVLGGEFRDESTDVLQDVFNLGVIAPLTNYDADRTIRAAFGEMAIPLMTPASDAANVPPSLELSLALRHEAYSDFGDATNPRIGVMWRPVETLLIRSSYGRSFIAPSLSQTDFPPSTTTNPLTIFDPVLNESYVFNTLIIGGNPDLKPERVRTWTAGIVYQPQVLRDTRLSLDYYDIDYANKIEFVAFPDAPRFEPFYPALVTRDPVTRRIVAISSLRVNLANVRTRGLDLGMRTAWPASFGTFDLSMNATYIDTYRTQDAPGATPVERVDTRGNPVDYKLSGSLFFTRGAFSTGLSARYVASYQSDAPATAEVSPFATLDATASYGLRVGSLGTLDIAFGVENVLDRDPPFYNSPAGFDFLVSDPRGRRYFVQLGMSF